MRAVAIAAVALVALVTLPRTRALAQERFRFGLVVHADRVDERWLGGQLEQANALFAPASWGSPGSLSDS
ncbi:MAG: hypothetical protein OHK0013_28490 [Sandaracinaceae bacterium]